jgi:energy-converting hydrogenase Eha subunit A
MDERRSRPLPVARRSWAEVRWRQFRHAPRPVVRAVLSSLVIAVVLGLGYLGYDTAIRHGAALPGGDLRTLYVVLDVAIVLVSGAVVTWLVVPQPRGSGDRTTRSGWSAALGFFAAVPVSYLVLVVVVQVLEPLIG